MTIGHADGVIIQSNKQVELANLALKKASDMGEPNVSQIKKMLSSHDFQEVEKLYDNYLRQYEKDVMYERLLALSYDLYSQANGISISDLDLWIERTRSYIAYTARGVYKAKEGFAAKGGKFIGETSVSQIEEMRRLLNEAAKDLQIATSKKPSFMPAYMWLVDVALLRIGLAWIIVSSSFSLKK